MLIYSALVTASAFVCCCCQVDNLPLIDVCGRSLAIMSGEGSCIIHRGCCCCLDRFKCDRGRLIHPLWLILVSAALLVLLFISPQTTLARATACARLARAASRARSPDRTRTAETDAESVSSIRCSRSKMIRMSLVIAAADRRNALVLAAYSRCLLVVVLIDVAARARPETAPRASRRSTSVPLRLPFTRHLHAAMRATEI